MTPIRRESFVLGAASDGSSSRLGIKEDSLLRFGQTETLLCRQNGLLLCAIVYREKTKPFNYLGLRQLTRRWRHSVRITRA